MELDTSVCFSFDLDNQNSPFSFLPSIFAMSFFDYRSTIVIVFTFCGVYAVIATAMVISFLDGVVWPLGRRTRDDIYMYVPHVCIYTHHVFRDHTSPVWIALSCH